ncbi:MAG: SusD/RagB family nutrient-binding outer membrane lipoprotein [Bacteroides sp.]|nr:SusD/RagB family nutrient-binding outer membrane lipoprotein [Bacteroides sp.]
MKLYKSLLAASMAGVVLFSTTGCREDFAEENIPPYAVVTPEPSFLLAQAVTEFEVSDYTYWFYNAAMYWKWSQLLSPTGGFTAQFTETTATGGQGSQYIDALRYRNDLNNYIATVGEDANKYKAYAAACNVLAVYSAIFDSDIAGDIAYTEAAMLSYGGPLTPKHDRLENLYDIWLSELDAAIAVFADKTQEMPNRANQDLVYGGDMGKWAKMANSLKLKIAARLLNNNKQKALSIAQEVANASCGYIDNTEDDMLFAKATTVVSGDNDKVYHFGNGITTLAATKPVVDFMKSTLDPRVRFFYTKDNFNSKIVQGFIDAGQYDQLPTYVKENAVLDENGNFQEWGGMGEPWVRYQGQVIAYEKQNDPAYAEFLNPGTRYNLKIGDATKSYNHMSYIQEEMVRGRVDFTLPTLPGDATIQDTDDKPWYGLYISTAEVNLYLAEFKLLGANLPQSAEYYYERGIRASVEAYDKVASLNDIPYYSKTYDYDPNEKVIALQAGEIDAMMATENIKLTGDLTLDLEKVYLQQLMHFTMMPDDQFVTARRSGCPKNGSTLINYEYFDGVAVNAIPRRFPVSDPSPTDKMKDILVESYKAQGFTTGSNQSGGAFNNIGSVLNTERIWFDQSAPNWGQGPKM